MKIDLTTSPCSCTKYIKIFEEQGLVVQKAFAGSGFSPEDIKTSEFNIEQAYHYGSKLNKVMDNWECLHVMKVEFTLALTRLNKGMDRLIVTWRRWRFFWISPSKTAMHCWKKMLAAAARNASRQTEILCAASKVRLGESLVINDFWGELYIIFLRL